MLLYVLSSETWQNVERGHKARLWATSVLDDPITSKGRWTKAQTMPLYARGMIWCVETNAFHMPFVVDDLPEERIEEHTWTEPWEFPFKIHPLKDPMHRFSLDLAKRRWPVCQRHKNMACAVRGIHGVSAFQPNRIQPEQWAQILDDMGADDDSAFPDARAMRVVPKPRDTAREAEALALLKSLGL